MKFYTTLLTFVIILVFVNCADNVKLENKKLENDLKSYFNANLEDTTSIVDSFYVVSIDTITPRMILYEQSSVLYADMERLIEYYELTGEVVSSKIDQVRLYKMLGSQSLVDIGKEDIDNEHKKFKLIGDDLDSLQSIINSIEEKLKNADSITTAGYQAKCFYQIRRKDKSVKQDTTFIILNKNKDIVARDEFVNVPFKLDFDKY
ncbi:MAG: hypothetical protein H0U27_02330 [Nitrosopumilus sp.]|nr:hypothetical protein [Nitrosopumilus sp.]